MDRTEPTAPVMHLWASAPAPDDPPARLAVSICPRCAAVVADEGSQHASWHASLTERGPR